MTPEKPTVTSNSQDWAGMDGATAFHLITRHSDNWSDAALMMDEWRRANMKQSALDHLRDCSEASFAEPLEGGLWLCVGTKESIAELVGPQWRPIATAPKDRPILVNDTSPNTASMSGAIPVCVATWLECDEWQGYIFDDEHMNDSEPLGPRPTHWIPLPIPPQAKEEG